jgi:hypothetical protein
MKRVLGGTAAALFAATALWPANAAAQAVEPWQFQGALYVYLPTLGGQTTFAQSGTGSDVSVDAQTILDNLKMTFMGTLEARRGAWGMFTDVIYMDLGNSKSDTRGLSVGGLPLPADATANATFDLKGTAWTLAGEYRMLADAGSTVDLFAGARLLDIKQTLDWQLSGNIGSIPLPGQAGKLSASLQNWDAIVGVKGRVALGAEKKWFAPVYLDVGTGESDLTWQAMAGVGYAFQWGEVVGVWRYLDWKMKSGSAVESLNFNGPAVAAVFHW